MPSPELSWTVACNRLGLADTATIPEIKRCFRKLALRYHPDRFLTPADRAIATTRFQLLAEAYSLLLKEGAPLSHPPENADHPIQAEPVPSIAPDRISVWTLLDPLRDRSQFLYFLFELLLLPSVLPVAFTSVPLFLLRGFLDRFPRLDHLATAISLRWGPALISLLLGYRRGNWWEWYFLLSGCTSIGLEFAAQVVGLLHLRRTRPALDGLIAEAGGIDDVA
jgi:hypothetical protein